MSAYQKGAKGKPIEFIQKDLNSLKCKPQLKVDGYFGPITEKAVKHFQKRVKVKTDGRVGSETTAALQFGGPLPEMTIPIYAEKDQKFLGTIKAYNTGLATHFKELDQTTNLVDNLLNKKVPAAEQVIKDNAPHYSTLLDVSSQVIALQKEFKLMRISNPSKAVKIVKECEKLSKQMDGVMSKMVTNFDILHGAIEETVATLGTGVRTMLKQQKALSKHMKKGNKIMG